MPPFNMVIARKISVFAMFSGVLVDKLCKSPGDLTLPENLSAEVLWGFLPW